MGNINGRFADQDSYVLTAQIQTSDNNQSTLNAALPENDFLRAKSAFFAQQSITRTVVNPVPDVSVVAANTVGAALGGVGQAGTVSARGGEGGEGGPTCFLGNTLISTWRYGPVAFSELYTLQIDNRLDDYREIITFDNKGIAVKGIIQEIFQTAVDSYWHVTFSDHTSDDVVPEHRYYTPEGIYVPIKKLLMKSVVYENGGGVYVISFDEVKVPRGIAVYNMHVSPYQNYVANGHRVHNLKPLPELQSVDNGDDLID